jgi:hypothetical protein
MGKEIIKTYSKKVIGFFKSVRFTAIILSLLILIYFIGLIIPQKWMFDTREDYLKWVDSAPLNRFLDFIRFTEIYLSPLTVTLLMFFFLNLLLVTINRVPVILRKAYVNFGPEPFNIDELKKRHNVRVLSVNLPVDAITEMLMSFLRKHRWHVFRHEGTRAITAVKNRYSPLGFLFFHLSFFLLLLGGILLTYTRFSGNLALTEGQTFYNDIKQFHRITRNAKILKQLPSLGLYLNRVYPFYENDVPTKLVIDLQVNYEGNVRDEVLRVNEPIKRGPMSIIAKSIGVSPLFVVRAPSGRVIDEAYVSLNVLKGQEDHFQFEWHRDITFYVKFFPDYIIENGVEKTKSIELKNPAIHLRFERKGEIAHEGTIRLGERYDLGMFSIGFEDIRYWAEFIVVREYGRLPIVAGFLLASVGLIMRLVFFQKRLRVAIEREDDKPVLYIEGRSEYFHHSFKEEMERVIKDFDNSLKGHHEDC